MGNTLYVMCIWFGLFGLSLIPLAGLLPSGLPITHDGQDHVARIANFYASLSEGNIIPRWAANLNWGYGHPVLMFLYPFPSYFATLFHVLGASIVDSVKLVFGVSYVLSVLLMYAWISSIWGKAAGLVSAILYGFAPYRFVDLYVRGAIGEHVAFIFPPLICLSLFQLYKRTDIQILYLIVTVFGSALLILSHNALSLMFFPLIFFYVFYLYSKRKRGKLFFLALSLICLFWGFLLSSFFWIPALFEGKYTLRNIVTAGEFSTRFSTWSSFLYSSWNYGGGNTLSKWLGAGQLLSLCISFFVLDKTKKLQRFIIGSYLLLLLIIFLMTNASAPIWNSVVFIQKFQFPWRLLSVTTFILALIGGATVTAFTGIHRRIAVLLIIVVSVVFTIPMWRAKEYKIYPESFFTSIYDSTTDTGESSPIWSVRFMEKRPDLHSFLDPPTGTIRNIKRTTTERVYSVSVNANTRFVENTLYFPGWKVRVNGTELPFEKLIFQDPTYRGLMTFDLHPGDHTIVIFFADTKMRSLANGITLFSFILFLLMIGTIRVWKKHKNV